MVFVVLSINVNNDYSIESYSIDVVNQDSLLNNLQLCGNEDIYFDYAQILKDKNDYYPKLELSILQHKLETKLNVKSDLEDEIAGYQAEITELNSKITKMEKNIKEKINLTKNKTINRIIVSTKN